MSKGKALVALLVSFLFLLVSCSDSPQETPSGPCYGPLGEFTGKTQLESNTCQVIFALPEFSLSINKKYECGIKELKSESLRDPTTHCILTLHKQLIIKKEGYAGLVEMEVTNCPHPMKENCRMVWNICFEPAK